MRPGAGKPPHLLLSVLSQPVRTTMGNVITITIEMDKKCSECRKGGATGSGICLSCASRAVQGKPMKSPEGKAAQKRVQAHIRKDLTRSKL